MKLLSFKLTMPNVGYWNDKWTGADKKYYIIKSVTDKFFNNKIQKLLDEKYQKIWYYNFGDGWVKIIQLQIIDAKEAKIRRKNSKGFAGYDWMVDSIMQFGEILNSDQRKERLSIK